MDNFQTQFIPYYAELFVRSLEIFRDSVVVDLKFCAFQIND